MTFRQCPAWAGAYDESSHDTGNGATLRAQPCDFSVPVEVMTLKSPVEDRKGGVSRTTCVACRYCGAVRTVAFDSTTAPRSDSK